MIRGEIGMRMRMVATRKLKWGLIVTNVDNAAKASTVSYTLIILHDVIKARVVVVINRNVVKQQKVVEKINLLIIIYQVVDMCRYFYTMVMCRGCAENCGQVGGRR